MSANRLSRPRAGLPVWWWPLLLVLALQLASLNKGFWGAHGESRRAETAREVLADGAWLTPTLLGEPFLTKPPLLYWSSAAAMGVFGVRDWAARLPAVLATLGSWLAMLWLGRSYAAELRLARGRPADDQSGAGFDTDGGDTAAAALVATPLVLAMALNAETEPLLLAFGLAAVAAVLALPPRGTPRRWTDRLGPGLFLALGFMTKGPLGWLFPLCGILAIEAGLPAGRRRLGLGDGAWILLMQALVALPWFLLVLARHPQVVELWLGESVARLSDPDFQVHREPWWYYLPRLAVLLPGLLFIDRGTWRDRVGRIPLVWLGLGVLFLSLATSKRTHYLLSLAPASALLPLAAAQAGRWARRREALLGGTGLFLPPLASAAMLWLMARGGLAVTPLTLLAVTLGPACSAWLALDGRGRGLERLAAGLLLTLLAGSPNLLRAVDGYRSPRAFYESCRSLTADSPTVLNWRNDRCSASFYLGRPVPPARSETELERLAPGPAWLFCQERDLEPLARPHRVVLRQTVADPFLPARRHAWVLVSLAAPVAHSAAPVDNKESHGAP